MATAFAPTFAPVTPAGLLARVREQREAARAAEVELMVSCVAWAAMHPAAGLEDAATVPGTDRGLAIGGEGVPLVAEFAVVELATALGRTADSARLWLGKVLEAAHRLPHTWARVQSGGLDPWRVLRIAEHTQALSWEAAAWVDVQIEGRAHKAGVVALEQLVSEAVVRFDPDEAYEDEVTTQADKRRVIIDRTHVFGGLVQSEVILDEADARDLDAAVAKVVTEMLTDPDLAGLGMRNASPQARRALALGVMARRELGADRSESRRDSTLYVHIDADALDQAPGEPSWARVEHGSSSYLISLDRLREWLTVAGTHLTIRPLIDLPETASVNGYEASDRLREHVLLRRPTCAFPCCSRPARRADLDHIKPYDAGGETTTENLAPLCRLHHRAKTHGGWSYTQLTPGEYLWHGPHHQTLHVDATGTTAL